MMMTKTWFLSKLLLRYMTLISKQSTLLCTLMLEFFESRQNFFHGKDDDDDDEIKERRAKSSFKWESLSLH